MTLRDRASRLRNSYPSRWEELKQLFAEETRIKADFFRLGDEGAFHRLQLDDSRPWQEHATEWWAEHVAPVQAARDLACLEFLRLPL